MTESEFTMKRSTGRAIGCLALALLCIPENALGEGLFVISNPEIDFEVIDNSPFDGIGDTGTFSTYSVVALGSTGEARQMAEFDLSFFSVPSGEIITKATFDVQITSIRVMGLGVPVGDTPDVMAAFGYAGNGLAELSDFQAGDDNFLGSLDTSSPFVGQILSYDVTSFVTALVKAGETWVGLTVAAREFGGVAIREGGEFPRLSIETAAVPEPDTLALLAVAVLGIRRRASK